MDERDENQNKDNEMKNSKKRQSSRQEGYLKMKLPREITMSIKTMTSGNRGKQTKVHE